MIDLKKFECDIILTIILDQYENINLHAKNDIDNIILKLSKNSTYNLCSKEKIKELTTQIKILKLFNLKEKK